MRDRRELIRQLDILLFTLFVYIWFLDKNLLLLALKIGLQVQYCNPASFNPDLPLPILCRTVLFFNLAPIVTHILFWTGKGMSPLDDVNGTGIGGAYSRSGRTGFVLDFVGQAYQPSKLHLLLLDLLTTFLQWLFIIVVSETEKAEELRPDLDEYGLLDGDPDQEIILCSPDQVRPYTTIPSGNRRDLSAEGRRSGATRSSAEARRGPEEADDDLSETGSDAPLRPSRAGATDEAGSASHGYGNTPAVPAFPEHEVLRSRKRKGRRQLGDPNSTSDLVTGSGAEAGRESVEESTGQGWSPRDEEASFFLPNLGPDAAQSRQRIRPRGHVLLSQRTSLTHPVAHLPLGQLFRNTFTFSSLPQPGHLFASGGQSTAVDNRREASSAGTTSQRRDAGNNHAGSDTGTQGRMIGSRLGIVPLFRRYHEGEEANAGPGSRPSQRSAEGPPRRQASASGTIPVIALPFSAPSIRFSTQTVPEPPNNARRHTPAATPEGFGGGGLAGVDASSSSAAGPASADAGTGRASPPGTPEENSWAWVMRNFSVPQIRSGQASRRPES
ncbi:hypothetical protein V8E36_002833 [Tilletia maclaganii]